MFLMSPVVFKLKKLRDNTFYKNMFNSMFKESIYAKPKSYLVDRVIPFLLCKEP